MLRRSLAAIGLPLLAAVVVAVLALLLRSPGATSAAGDRADAGVQSGHVTVRITNFAFVPDSISVTAGTHVTFVNEDATAHTATATDGAFDTGAIQPHHQATVTVRRAGTYGYSCLFHAFMTGTLRVVR